MPSQLGRIDSRLIYVILLLGFVIPIIRPLGLPMTISEQVQSVYDLIESFPPGTPVIVSFDIGPGAYEELGPTTIAVFNHLARKNVRLIGLSFWQTGPTLLEKSIEMSLYADKEYGTDYVNLGFLAGGENAIAFAAKDILGAFGKDYHGNSSSAMPIFTGIHSFQDVELALVVATGNPGVPEWIRQVGDPMGVSVGTILFSGLVADYAPYVQSKQLTGVIAGLRGAAAYEALTGIFGRGTAGLDAQSVAHLLILLFVFFGNIIYIFERRQETKNQEQGT